METGTWRGAEERRDHSIAFWKTIFNLRLTLLVLSFMRSIFKIIVLYECCCCGDGSGDGDGGADDVAALCWCLSHCYRNFSPYLNFRENSQPRCSDKAQFALPHNITIIADNNTGNGRQQNSKALVKYTVHLANTMRNNQVEKLARHTPNNDRNTKMRFSMQLLSSFSS